MKAELVATPESAALDQLGLWESTPDYEDMLDLIQERISGMQGTAPGAG